MFLLKMFLGHFCKIFLNAKVHSRFLNLLAKRSLNTQSSFRHFIKSTTTITSYSSVTCNHASEIPRKRKSILLNISRTNFANAYFVEYLSNNSDRYCVVNTNNINLEEETNFDSLKLLKDFINSPETEEIPEDLINILKKELCDYSLEEIYKFIILTSNCHNSHRINLMKHLSDELLSRKLPVEDRLKVLFVIRKVMPEIMSHKSFKFSFLTLKKCYNKIYNLNPQQAVQVMSSFMKKVWPSSVLCYFTVQQYFVDKIPHLNSDELGMMANGFLRTTASLTETNLLLTVINKTTEEIENIKDIPLILLCKLFFCFSRVSHGDALLNFQEKVIPHLPKLGLSTLINIAGTGSGIKCMHSSLWEIVANTLKKNIDNFTLLQILSIVQCATENNITDEELLSLAIKRFETGENSLQYPKYLIFFLYSLALHKLYPENLLSLILSKKFLSEVKLGSLGINTKIKYYFINCCVELDIPTHNFESLDSKTRRKLFGAFKSLEYSDNTLTRNYYSNKSIIKVLQNNYGENSVFYTFCLPHFMAGIVMRFDKALRAQSIPEEFKHFEAEYAKKAPQDDHIWIFITSVTYKQFLYKSKSPSLLLQTQIRQLEAIGYKTILIHSIEWRCLQKTGDGFEFLKNEITKNLEELLQKKSVTDILI